MTVPRHIAIFGSQSISMREREAAANVKWWMFGPR